MSRIGKKPITILKGVTVQVNGQSIEVKGPQGTLTRQIPQELSAVVEKDQLLLSVKQTESPNARALHGLNRTLLSNMVQGVSTPWKKDLEIHGVGYRASKAGQTLNLALGFSHPIEFKVPEKIKFEVDGKQTLITMSSADKDLLGIIAAEIRSLRPPEPYKGKGVRYLGEHILRKAGKAAGAVGGGAAGGGKK